MGHPLIVDAVMAADEYHSQPHLPASVGGRPSELLPAEAEPSSPLPYSGPAPIEATNEPAAPSVASISFGLVEGWC
jgi:hypothetical protein